MKKRVSLQTKLLYSVVAIMVVSISLIGYYGYSEAKDGYVSKIEETENNDIESITQSIKDTISVLKKDANFIANFYAMQKLLNWQSVGVQSEIAIWDKATKDTFISMIELKNFYYKLRILDLDGMEKMSVFFDQKRQEIVIQNTDKLQNKSNERYYTEALNLNAGENYVSQMELNTEFGKITYPYVPVVHFTSAIYDKSGRKRGYAVINAYAKNILSALKKHTKDYKKSYMVDNNGFYLFNEDENKLWGWQLKNSQNLKMDNLKLYDEVIKNLKGSYEHNGKYYTYERIYPDKKNQTDYWIVISEVNVADVFAPLANFETLFASILLVTIILVMFILSYLIKTLISPLVMVTQQIESLAKGELIESKINYNSNDEISDLVDSSKILVRNIQATIEQSKSVAMGDFSKRLELSSKDDALSLSVNEMTNRLEESAKIAKKLSMGDIDTTHINVYSDKDILAQSLNYLIEYFQQITKIAESISLGNYNVNFKPASDKDRLGIAVESMIQTLKQVLQQSNAIIEGDYSKNFEPKSDDDRLGFALQKMTQTLMDNKIKTQKESWLKDGLNQLASKLSGLEDIKRLGNEMLSRVVKHVSGASGVLYIYNDEKEELLLSASYAFVDRESLMLSFKKGEGVIGQVALEEKPILLKNITKEEYKVESGIISQQPLNSYTFPMVYEGKLLGVVEVVSFEHFSDTKKEFMNQAAEISSAYFFNVAQNEQIKVLLEKSQIAFEELQIKSEELQESNVQMEEQQQQLEMQSEELKIQNQNLEEAKLEIDKRAEELEKASKYKSEFLANMSHELRTPLNSIILLSKLLSQNQENTLSQKDIEKSKVIHKAGNDLLLLINDILDLSKIESGKMDFIYEDVASSEILEDMRGLFTPIADDKNIKFIIDDKFNSTFNTDKAKLSQVLKNLLSNAFKFTKHGFVEVILEKLENNLNIVVKDSGIGIPNDKLHTIFEAFKQVDGSISREFGGTGLGLSITKTIVDLMDGEVSVQSTQGEGTAFTIVLPLNKEIKSIESKYTQPIQKNQFESNSKQSISKVNVPIFEDDELVELDVSELKGKNILVVDDDSRNIFTLTSVLENLEAEVYSAFNGKEAIEILEGDDEIDLVLMDIMMPVMDGLKAIENIRKNELCKDIPIIAITAKTMPEDKQKCLDAGANDYLQKPLEHNALISMIKAWIN